MVPQALPDPIDYITIGCLLIVQLEFSFFKNLFLLSFFFLMWTIFESLYWICCFCSVLLFWLQGMWDLCSPNHGSNSHPYIGKWSLNHRTGREVPSQNYFARHLASRKRVRVKIRIKLREKEPELGHITLGTKDRQVPALFPYSTRWL